MTITLYVNYFTKRLNQERIKKMEEKKMEDKKIKDTEIEDINEEDIDEEDIDEEDIDEEDIDEEDIDEEDIDEVDTEGLPMNIIRCALLEVELREYEALVERAKKYGYDLPKPNYDVILKKIMDYMQEK